MHKDDHHVGLLFCDKCRLQHDPAKECVPLTLTWWQSGPWKGPRRASFQPTSEDDPLIRYFNPSCKHDRCSFTIANCNACVAYTRDLKAARAGAKTATDVVPKK